MYRSLLWISALVGMSQAAAEGIRWHPGHYVILNGGGSVLEHLRHIDDVGGEQHIRGVMIRIWWYELETSRGRYDFSKIETYLDQLRRQPTTKRLVVRVMDRRFGTTSASNIVPSYLRNDRRFNGGVVRTKTGYAARLWERPVMDRRIALYRAIGSRFDDDPLFEGLFTEESTLSLPEPLPWGYSNAALTQEYVRFVNEVKPAMPRSNLFMNVNWIGSSSLMSELVQSFVQARVAAGGSDVIPGSKTLAQRVLTGEFGSDYRWELPIASAVETGELGGNLGDFTPEQIASYAYDVLHVHYLFWVRNTWGGSSAQRWDSGILPLLRSNPPIRTRCPNSYGVCDRQ